MVSATFRRIVSPCWRPSIVGENSSRYGDASGRSDGLLWYKDSGRHANGEFSMAVVQANNLLEDHSQVESGPMSLIEGSPRGNLMALCFYRQTYIHGAVFLKCTVCVNV
ncbi:putative protein phosphatase 2C 38-like [Trifolium medium]|uniref:Uncharacterized protein n=1 Tax=Trifolium medium TaxID=97028 RepID=A0A392MSV2_9FABA|nr:putative protein phosphatase 2C 38-like [Trifolium medium]